MEQLPFPPTEEETAPVIEQPKPAARHFKELKPRVDDDVIDLAVRSSFRFHDLGVDDSSFDPDNPDNWVA